MSAPHAEFPRGWFLIRHDGKPYVGPVPAFGGSVRLEGSEAWLSRDGDDRQLPTHRQFGACFVWYSADASIPAWTPESIEGRAFSSLSYFSFELETTPRLIMRDLADGEHFETVHGYRNVEPLRPFSVDGHRANLRLACTRDQTTPLGKLPLRITFDCTCLGVGLQVADVHALGGALKTRHLVCPTPIDARRTRLTLAVAASMWMSRDFDKRGRAGPWFAFLAPLFLPFLRAQYRKDVACDARLWLELANGTEADAGLPSLAAFHAWADQFDVRGGAALAETFARTDS